MGDTSHERKLQAYTGSRVCELQIRKEDVLRETEYFDEKSGTLLRSPLQYPKLKGGAIPMLVSDKCPPSLQPTMIVSRESPSKKRRRLEDKLVRKAQEASIETANYYMKRVTFTNLAELKQCVISQGTDAYWTTIFKGDYLSVMHLTNLPDVLCSVNIDKNLNVSVLYKKVELKKLGTFQFPLRVTNINVFFEILSSLKMLAHSGTTKNSEDIKDVLEVLISLLNKIKNHKSKNEEDKFIDFMIEQLSNLNVVKKHRRYSYEFLIFCSLLKSISPHCYSFLRNSKVFILPHESTLRRVCSEFGVNPSQGQDDDSFLSYITQKFNFLGDKDKTISLMIDEIHLRPTYDYVGGKLYGMSYNSSNAATSAFVFMVQSLLSSYKDVAHILPVSTLTAEMFHSFLNKVIIGLETIGFKVIVVVTDNNAINKKAVSLFSNPP
ncbi:hypothetical protein AVEN_103646-1 [Araneus ventricosus]|uniref:Transposable element P transposase n=1 Tax=Araneus ventricosus TaxID=182803 RepID=A0A4Y2UAU2_ARAVE|nr:hypothetical protein AVEN_103646-1 [Araneus ventricosus]